MLIRASKYTVRTQETYPSSGNRDASYYYQTVDRTLLITFNGEILGAAAFRKGKWVADGVGIMKPNARALEVLNEQAPNGFKDLRAVK